MVDKHLMPSNICINGKILSKYLTDYFKRFSFQLFCPRQVRQNLTKAVWLWQCLWLKFNSKGGFRASCFSKMVVTQKNFWAGKRLFKDKFYIFQANYVACVTGAWVISPRASSRSRARLAHCSNSLPIIIRVHVTRLSSYYFMYLPSWARWLSISQAPRS